MSTPNVYYPPANRDQWFGDDYPGITMPTIEKLLLHTTETSGWPGYDGGAKAPTLTYHPKLHVWRQHFAINQSARALRDPSETPVRENRDGVVQVEIIATCNPDLAGTFQYVTKLDDQALNDLSKFAAWLHTEWGLKLAKAPIWLPYPQSGWTESTARMTSEQFDAFKGICGHMHASGNDHGDPGAISIDRILTTAQRLTEDTMSLTQADIDAVAEAVMSKHITAVINGQTVDLGTFRGCIFTLMQRTADDDARATQIQQTADSIQRDTDDIQARLP